VGVVAGVALGGALAVLVAVPLAWKWQLGALRATAVVCMVAAVVGVVVAVIGNATNLGLPLSAVVVWTLTVTAAAGITACRFYRDPDRLPPTREDVVVSPCGRNDPVRTRCEGWRVAGRREERSFRRPRGIDEDDASLRRLDRLSASGCTFSRSM